MPTRDPDAIATEIVLLVKTAITPVLERLASVEALLKHNGDVRDRLVTLETKAAQPLPAQPDPPEIPDLTPILERLASAEAKLGALGDVRDRVVAVEAKALQPVWTMPPEAGFDDLKDRLKTLETRAEGPSPTDMALVDVRERMTNLERRMSDETMAKEVSALRERVGIMEVKGQMPGPPGKDGANGKDGIGFDDLSVEFDGDRTLALKFERGDVTKTFPIALPFLRYKGIYQQGQEYVQGDTVTYANQLWYCHEPTITPPNDGSKVWQLCVRKGRDGRDGRDAPTVPVVSIGGRS